MAVCIGRRSVANDLGLENIGLETDENGWIAVDEHMQTRVDNVYAIGDVLGPKHVMLAHVAYHEGLVAAANACGQTGAPKTAMSYDTVPGAIFTMPEIGTVGLTEEQAREQGIDIETAVVNFRSLGKAHAIDQIAGEAKMIVEKNSGKVLGVHMTGPHATDLIAEAALAVRNGIDSSGHSTHHPCPSHPGRNHGRSVFKNFRHPTARIKEIKKMAGSWDFDQIIDRSNTGSTKWEPSILEEKFGKGRGNLLPLWVADMDFSCPDVIFDAMEQRLWPIGFSGTV